MIRKVLISLSHPLMTNRLLLCLLIALSLSAISVSAQDQSASNSTNPPAAPLQIQDNAQPEATPAPSLFSTSPAGVPASNAPTPSPADTAGAASNQASNPITPADPLAPGANSGVGSPGQNPPQSDPNSLIPPPIEPSQPSPINTAGNEEKQRQDQKAKYYAAKVKADKEEALASLLTKSDKAKSDETKREILREYYDLLAKRMKKIDPSISEWIDTMHAAYLRRIQQIRVEPSIPEGLPPAIGGTPSASPSPSSSETPGHHKKKTKTDVNESATPSASPKPSPSAKGKSSSKPSPSPIPSKKSQSNSSAKASPSPLPKSSEKKKADSNND